MLIRIIIKSFLVLLLSCAVLMSSCSNEGNDSENGDNNGQIPTVDWAADGVITSGEYAKTTTFGNFALSWRSDTQNIYIGMRVKTTGWISLGIKPTSAMKDADIILGYVDGSGTTITDQFGTSSFVHELDTSLGGTNDIITYGGSESGGYTVIEFSRALDAGDEYDQVITSGDSPIIWAYGSTDVISNRHATRGSGTLNL
ncbi:DOMON domain-containing protein [Chloroflexota bacterium]